MPTTTLVQLRALNPCAEGSAIAERVLPGQPFTAVEARAAGVSYDDVLWGVAAIARTDPEFRARLDRWLDDCANHARQLAGYDYTGVERDGDEHARWRDFDQMRLDAAVRAATRYVSRVAWAASNRAAGAAAKSGALAGAMSGGRAVDAARTAATAAWRQAKKEAREREEAWQFDRLVERFSDPEPPAVALL